MRNRHEKPEEIKIEEVTIAHNVEPMDVIIVRGEKYFFNGEEIFLDKVAGLLNVGAKMIKEN